MKTSIIVPVYNESETLGDLLRHCSELESDEILIVDGGSTDGTRERLGEEAEERARVLESERGRARQMNSGALRANGDVLLFLHADTRLPTGGLGAVARALAADPSRRWGRFDVRFDRAGPVLKTVARAMNLRSAVTGICTGDQAMFVYRDDFLRLGGFAPVPLMEDVELSARLKRLSRPCRIREPVTTSSRRWRDHGAWRTVVLMWRLRWLYWRGVPTTALASRYYRRS